MDYPFVSCFEPRRIRNKYTGEMQVVRCGHCVACEQFRNFKYSNQCDFESLTAVKTVFLTLTFDDDNVPFYRFCLNSNGRFDMVDIDTGEVLGEISMSKELLTEYHRKVNYRINYHGCYPYLRKRDVQLFLKRLRKYLDKYEGQKIRYFVTGEYGPESFRPHFHILLYVYDLSLFLPSSHMLGEYPFRHWSKYQRKYCRKGTLLSKLEYYIRQSWSLGSVDAQSVEQGSCSSYVAGYVNSSVPLPDCLKVQSVKPFSQHSRFLGRKIFGQELIPLLQQKFTEFVERSFFCRGKFDTFRTPFEVFSSVYPKCKGFACLSHAKRLAVYTISKRFRQYFFTDRLADISRTLVDSYYNWKEDELSRLPERYRDDFLYIFGELDLNLSIKEDYRRPDELRSDDDVTKKLFQCVYDILLCSSVFLHNAETWSLYLRELSSFWTDFDAYELFLKKIEWFWKRLDYRNLIDWYQSQERYFDRSYSKKSEFFDDRERLTGDIKYFFNNVPYDIERFKKTTFAYKAFRANTNVMARERMKHKQQNDKNMIFDSDYYG